MTFRFVGVRRYRRGAFWPDGEPRFCTTCSSVGRRRRRQAVVTALLRREGQRTSVPVGYCQDHAPEDLR